MKLMKKVDTINNMLPEVFLPKNTCTSGNWGVFETCAQKAEKQEKKTGKKNRKKSVLKSADKEGWWWL